MKTPHKHAEAIKAWADGAQIEYYNGITGNWCDASDPTWCDRYEYRVKKDPVITHAYHGIGVTKFGDRLLTHTTGMYEFAGAVPKIFESRSGKWETSAVIRTKFVDGKAVSVELV